MLFRSRAYCVFEHQKTQFYTTYIWNSEKTEDLEGLILCSGGLLEDIFRLNVAKFNYYRRIIYVVGLEPFQVKRPLLQAYYS